MNLQPGNQIAPGVIIYEDVIDNCEELIALAKSYGEEKRSDAKVGNDLLVIPEHRTATVIDISATFNNDIEWFIVAKKIWEYGNQYAIDNSVYFSTMEYLQFVNYEKNGGFYVKHADSGGISIERIFSAVLYLNDLEEGGETYFNKLDISVHPKKGRLVLFPANYVYEHEARKPVSDEKNVIVTWFRG